MLRTSRFAAWLLLAPAFAAPAAANDKVYVADSAFLWDLHGQPNVWDEAYYNCFDAVSVAQVGEFLLSVDGDGRFSYAHLKTRYVQVLLQLPVDGVDVAAHGGDALVAGSDGRIVRLDGKTWQPKGALSVDAPISALTTRGDLVAVGSSTGELWLGNATSGDFTSSCVVPGPITSLLELDGTLFFATQSGAVWRCDVATGGIGFGFQAGNDAQTMAVDAGTLLVGGTDKTIERRDPKTGALLETLLRDQPVRALANYSDPRDIDLHSVTHSMWLAQGVDYDLVVEAGPEHAGEYYLVLGSLQPAWFPGTELFVDGVGLPLAIDDYFLLTLSGGASSFLKNARGFLPANGSVTAKFALPAGSASLTQIYAVHAAVTLDLGAGAVSASSTWRQLWGL
ncbi:MAG: hypothetical protein EPO68_03535 [Planctomycetota bacterium]|nr:MAG: hypothetical protein EPO68_03535 [Planctomycetota bacterium]